MALLNKTALNLSEGIRLRNFSLLVLCAAIVAYLFSNVQILATEPWPHFLQMLKALVRPNFSEPQTLAIDLLYTVSFALLGVSLAVLMGTALSLLYRYSIVRLCCAFLRAIHELFWALIFIQIFGLSAITAILAIGIPYACTFARVFHDIYQQAPVKITNQQTADNAKISNFCYVLLPQVWPQMQSYLRYRFECGIRTSAVLGFVGLPTIGFHLETAFKQGDYSYAGALLISFYLLIASIKHWIKLPLLPLYLLAAYYFLPDSYTINSGENMLRFITVDIWPRGVLNTDQGIVHSTIIYWQWFVELLLEQGLSGIGQTITLTVLALAATLVFCVMAMPILVLMHNYVSINIVGKSVLLVARSTAEYILAFVLLLLLGPSMLPAMLALAIHNSALISYLLARNMYSLALPVKLTISEFLYKVLPSLYVNFISLLMYRAEIILRESAILGVLGIATLGFYIDSAFEELRFDRALALLLMTAFMNILLDQFSRKMQLLFTSSAIRVRSRD
ncbi:MAG: phosphonate transport system permease protein [Oceanospirillaceae bacterium]|jgi:phosphonate transport system permease protein